MGLIKRRSFLEKVSIASLVLSTAGSCTKSEKKDKNTLTSRNTENPLYASKVLLYSGWNTHNIGDQGHTPGTLRFLEKNFPEAIITVWLYKTNDEQVSSDKDCQW